MTQPVIERKTRVSALKMLLSIDSLSGEHSTPAIVTLDGDLDIGLQARPTGFGGYSADETELNRKKGDVTIDYRESRRFVVLVSLHLWVGDLID